MESSQNDSPIVDSIAYLESQGVPTDDEDEDDIHFCKKCKQVFKKLESYLEHKVKHDKFKVSYNRAPGDRRMVLPTLRKRETAKKPDATAGVKRGNDQTASDNTAVPRKRRKKKSPCVDIQLITERNTYICNTCDRKFSREASLKWHILYDHHKAEGTSDEEDEEDGDGGDGEEGGEGEEDQGGDLNFKVREPGLKKVMQVSVAGGDDDRPYKCEVCFLGFKEVAVLKTHMLTHSNVRQYRCTYQDCPYAFKTKGSLVRHVRRHTGERPYACESCGRSFAESGALTRHMRSRKPCTSKTDADLPRYGKKWTYIPNIPAVISDQDKNDDGSAGANDDDDDDGAGYVSVVPGEMVMVVTEGENGEQIFTEAQIVGNNETVVSAASLEDGGVVSEMEEGELGEHEVGELVAASDLDTLTPTQCKVCREECVEVEGLRAHLRLHLADFPFHCGFCHFTTEDRHDLRSHLQSKHLMQLKGIDPNILLPPTDDSSRKEGKHSSKDTTEAQTAIRQILELPISGVGDRDLTETLSARAISRCPVCNRVFRGSSYLKQHMKSHAGDRPHECQECHKSFVTKDALNKHLIVHSDQRTFQCGQCGKMFKRLAHVREHLKIHSASRPFPCSVCDKSFKTNNALKVHMRTHSNCFPYECNLCHRHFREKGSMQRHLRTHTGERPFSCHRCGRGFAEHGTLNRHLKAKVQCITSLQYRHLEGGGSGVEEEGSLEMEIKEEAAQGRQASGDMPTVLAEFSSVVADTQQYIVADQLTEADGQATEYVVLHTDLSGEDLTNVEIVTEGGDITHPDHTHAILSAVTAAAATAGSGHHHHHHHDDGGGGGTALVVVSEAGNQLRIIDSSTGLTLATVPQERHTPGPPTPTHTHTHSHVHHHHLGVRVVGGSHGVEEVEEAVKVEAVEEEVVEERVVVPRPSGEGEGLEGLGTGGTITVFTDSAGHIILSPQENDEDDSAAPPAPTHTDAPSEGQPPRHHHPYHPVIMATGSDTAEVEAATVTLETVSSDSVVTLHTTPGAAAVAGGEESRGDDDVIDDVMALPPGTEERVETIALQSAEEEEGEDCVRAVPLQTGEEEVMAAETAGQLTDAVAVRTVIKAEITVPTSSSSSSLSK